MMVARSCPPRSAAARGRACNYPDSGFVLAEPRLLRRRLDVEAEGFASCDLAAFPPRQLRSNPWKRVRIQLPSEGQDPAAVDPVSWRSWVEAGVFAWRGCSDSSSESSAGFSTACLP